MHQKFGRQKWTATCGCVMHMDHGVNEKGEAVFEAFETERSCAQHKKHKKCGDRYLAMLDHSCDEQKLPRYHRR